MIICDICYDTKAAVACFGECSLKICLDCFNKILKLNVVGDIEYCCPQCRITSIKNKDNHFSQFINSNNSTLIKIIQLLEKKVDSLQVLRVLTQWNSWNDASLNIQHDAIDWNDASLNIPPFPIS